MSHAVHSIYPPGPADVPRDFTRPTPRYRLQVIAVLLSLFLSLLLYLALVAGSAWLCYHLVTAPWPARAERDSYPFFRFVAIVCSGLLFLYLLRGLFKGTKQDRTLLVEISAKDQPRLFDFIRQVCADTRAPFPKKIFVSPDVNAAVFYHSSFLSLFLPTRKNLLIGLGLVNMIDLSEFKAVLAHEFGHFSQKSMKVGSYVYVASRVLGDIIYGRDWLDRMLSQAKSWDLRIAIFVWIFLGILWGLRKVLESVFKAINLTNLSLMRLMEFNADRVAVSVAGSDAIVLGLLRSSYADQAFRQLAGDLWAAADHKLYSRDVFAHQKTAGERVRFLMKRPQLGERPAERGPSVQVFTPGEDGIGPPPMWATHPSNADREASAKAHYLAAALDERPCWLLFDNAEELRFEVTRRYYHVYHKLSVDPPFSDVAAVQRFLDEEYAETTYAERYAGLYDNRYLEIEDLTSLLRRADVLPPPLALRHLDEVYAPTLAGWVTEYNKRLDDFDLLAALVSGRIQPKGPKLEFRGQPYAPTQAKVLLEQVGKEIEEDRAYLGQLDERVFLACSKLAVEQPDLKQELVERYRFHLAAQEMHRNVIKSINETQNILAWASSRRELSPEDFAAVRHGLTEAAGRLHQLLRDANERRIPALRNISAGTVLRDFLLHKPVVRHLGTAEQTIAPDWIQELLGQLAEVQDKLKRILFKSMGGILALQERIVDKYRQKTHAEPATTAPVSG
ncbi:MAG: M48 family metallopeptidase [Gemmataceae bacterium]